MPHRIWNSFAGGQYGFKGLKWEAAWCERLGNWDVAQSKSQCGNPKYTGLGTPITWPGGTTFSDTRMGRWVTDSPIFHLQQLRHKFGLRPTELLLFPTFRELFEHHQIWPTGRQVQSQPKEWENKLLHFLPTLKNKRTYKICASWLSL